MSRDGWSPRRSLMWEERIRHFPPRRIAIKCDEKARFPKRSDYRHGFLVHLAHLPRSSVERGWGNYAPDQVDAAHIVLWWNHHLTVR